MLIYYERCDFLYNVLWGLMLLINHSAWNDSIISAERRVAISVVITKIFKLSSMKKQQRSVAIIIL